MVKARQPLCPLRLMCLGSLKVWSNRRLTLNGDFVDWRLVRPFLAQDVRRISRPQSPKNLHVVAGNINRSYKYCYVTSITIYIIASASRRSPAVAEMALSWGEGVHNDESGVQEESELRLAGAPVRPGGAI
jgi:hypothetical protein